MPELADDVQAALLRGVGAYLRGADRNELPPPLRRLRGFRPAALAKHKGELLGALDLAPTRALILQWLEESKPPLAKADGAILRTAAEGGEGWRDSFPSSSPAVPAGNHSEAAIERLQEQLERERARTGKAREAERIAKDALAEATRRAGLETAAQSRELARLRTELEARHAELAEHRATVAKLTEERTRERRRGERDLQKERRARQEAERALKGVRRDLRNRDEELAGLRRKPGAKFKQGGTDDREERQDAIPGGRRRQRLKAPHGLLDDDPKSLDRWLRTENVRVLIDGYNVSKSGTGFANLSLEDQRNRVVEAVTRLARKNNLTPIVVFDGAETQPGTSRRLRGPVVVEYSTGEIADDHLIARLEALPEDPVVFVTDDRELQGRAATLGATIATSAQLLALAR
jgi:predicted RNA-binding protein with PIN domain